MGGSPSSPTSYSILQTIAAVAEEVGYASAFALSAAFKRIRGISPRQHRRALAA